MNKFLMVVSLIGVFFSMNVFAQDEVFQSDGKKIIVTDTSVSSGIGMTKEKINKSLFNKGVYVIVNNGIVGATNNRLDGAEKIVSEIFIKNGIKIVDKIEDADMAFMFGSIGGSLNIIDANNYAKNSVLPNGNQIASAGGQIINGVLTNGVIPGLVGAAAVFIYNPDSKVIISSLIVNNPIKKKNFFGVEGIASSVDKYDGKSLSVSYKLEKNNEAPANIVLEMAVDQWIKKFVVNDAVDSQIAKTDSTTKPVETPVVTKTTPPVSTPAEATQPQAQ